MQTSCYGSADAGLTVHAENYKLNAKMRLAAEKLNIKVEIKKKLIL